MRDDSISVTSTTVRIPVMGGHSESVNVEFENDFDLEEVKQLLNRFSGSNCCRMIRQNKFILCHYGHMKKMMYL